MSTQSPFLDNNQKKLFPHAMFKYVFGRSPNLARDKTFLMNYLTTVDKTNREIIESYINRGVTKQQLSAIYETGISPSGSDYKKYPLRIIRKWRELACSSDAEAAIDRRLKITIYDDPVGSAATTIYQELSSSTIRICHLLDTGATKARSLDSGIFFLYVLTRCVQILRSIRVLINNDEDSSILVLVRGLYECFSRLVFVNRCPDLAAGLVLAGLVDGERFEFCKNRAGRIERRRVRDMASGKEHKVDYSIGEMFHLAQANRDAEIHAFLYYTLSAEVHPSAELMFEFLQQKMFMLHRPSDTLYTLYITGYVLFLLWREIAVFPPLSKRDRRDANHGLSVIRSAMLTIVDILAPHIERKEGLDDEFASLFLNTRSVLLEPYNDAYWNSIKSENGRAAT